MSLGTRGIVLRGLGIDSIPPLQSPVPVPTAASGGLLTGNHAIPSHHTSQSPPPPPPPHPAAYGTRSLTPLPSPAASFTCRPSLLLPPSVRPSFPPVLFLLLHLLQLHPPSLPPIFHHPEPLLIHSRASSLILPVSSFSLF